VPDGRARDVCLINLNGGIYGKEEKGQESGKEKEEEESGRKESEEEIGEETREKSGQEEGKAENGQEDRAEAGCSHSGIGGNGSFDGGDAGRGEDRPEPRCCVALSDGLQALGGGELKLRSVRGPVPRAGPQIIRVVSSLHPERQLGSAHYG
jgi:hypothetical protein